MKIYNIELYYNMIFLREEFKHFLIFKYIRNIIHSKTLVAKKYFDASLGRSSTKGTLHISYILKGDIFVPHNDKGPSFKYLENEFYFNDGKLHRNDGPAVILNHEEKVIKEWFYYGDRINNVRSLKVFNTKILYRLF